MSLRHKGLLSVLVICFAILGWKAFDKYTHGFYPSRVLSNSFINQIELFECSQEAKEALNQDYEFLGSGSQCYAFVSKDRQYVLKFFKHYRWESPWYLPFLFMKKEKKDLFLQKREEGKLATFQSCVFSFKELKKESALIYLQLHPKP